MKVSVNQEHQYIASITVSMFRMIPWVVKEDPIKDKYSIKFEDLELTIQPTIQLDENDEEYTQWIIERNFKVTNEIRGSHFQLGDSDLAIMLEQMFPWFN